MGKTIIFCDREEVARRIASVLGDTDICNGQMGESKCYAWASPSLLSWAKPEAINPEWGEPWKFEVLPIVPDTTPIKSPPGAQDELDRIYGLFTHESVERILVATEPSSQGELFFYHLYDSLPHASPAFRLWLPSLAEDDIRESLTSVQGIEEYNHLLDWERTKNMDWEFEVNLTRALSLKHNLLTPFDREAVAALGWCRDQEEGGQTYKITASFFHEGQFFKGEVSDEQGKPLYSTKEEAEALRSDCSLTEARVTQIQRSQVEVSPPPPFNLADLQIAALKHGLTFEQTLNTALRLYEKGFLTWPKTVSREICQSALEGISQVFMAVHAHNIELVDIVLDLISKKQITPAFVRNFENGEHGAILPTNMPVVFSELTDLEATLYSLVVNQLVMAFLPNMKGEKVEASLDLEGATVLCSKYQIETPGWVGVSVDPLFKTNFELEEEDSLTPVELLVVNEHGMSGVRGLLRSFEDNLFGTPGSRTRSITRLFENRWVEFEGNLLVVSERGRFLLEQVESCELLKHLTSVSSSSVWLSSLFSNAGGRAFSRVAFERIYRDVLRRVCFELWDSVRIYNCCPLCGGTISRKGKAYSCENRGQKDGCGFSVWAQAMGRDLPPKVLDELLEFGISETRLTFISKKKGTEYQARLQLDSNTWRVSLYFPPPKKVALCPVCADGELVEKEKGFSCTNWKNTGCKFTIWKGLDGPNAEDIQELMNAKRTSKAFLYEFEGGKKRRFRLFLEGTNVVKRRS